MKLIVYLLVFVGGLSNLHSQNIDLKQLVTWRNTNYQIIDELILNMGWEKSTLDSKTDSVYRNNQYLIDKGSKNEQVLRISYSNNYKLENNTISYSTIKNEKYDSFVNQIKSSEYKLFKSKKNENVISDYYRSDNITVIFSVLKSFDIERQEIQFFTIYLCTNDNYNKSHTD